MSYENDHPMRQDARRYYGDTLDDETQRWFLRLPAENRRAYLAQLSSVVTQADGISLKRKSQVMRDHQTLARLDAELRAISR
jgi:hypothetical protein